jgi:hypothetical protein
MKNSQQEFLNELSVYPASYEIDEASNYAQDQVNKYLIEFGSVATIEDGEVYGTEKLSEDIQLNAQSIFEEAFSEKINELQSFTNIPLYKFKEIECENFEDFAENAEIGQSWRDENAGKWYHKYLSATSGDAEIFYVTKEGDRIKE